MNFTLLALRLVVGLGMLSHGYGKLDRLFGTEPIDFADPIGIGPSASLFLTVFSEVFCSILLVFGLATRLAATPLLITMLVIVFVVHIHDGFKKMELPMIYGVIYLGLILCGAGRYSMDRWISVNCLKS